MALYIPQSILHLARSLYVRPETYGPTYIYDGFDSELALELNPEVITLTPGTSCILKKTPQTVKYAAQIILPGVAGADTSLACSFGKSAVSGVEVHGKMCHLSRCATKQSASFTLSSLISQNYNLVVYC